MLLQKGVIITTTIILILVFDYRQAGLVSTTMEELFSNPLLNGLRCNKMQTSFICNPDNVLKDVEAESLNILAHNLRRTTPCLCQTCNSKAVGASFGVLIQYNLTSSYNSSEEKDLGVLAQQLRRQWHLGTCEDDITVLVVAWTREANFSVGSAIEAVIKRKVGEQIFAECIVHFENSNFYQGLESMIYSFQDVLRRFQRPRKKPPPSSRLSIITGVCLGVLVLLLLIATAAFIRYRQIRKRKFGRSDQGKQEAAVVKHKFEYQLCNDNNNVGELTKSRNGSGCSDDEDKSNSDDDEGADCDADRLTVLWFFESLTKRQLSDVTEENEDELEASIRFSMVDSPRNNKMQITEL